MPINHLANEKSPYLLQHVENPVDWYPWGEEAFEKARRENKPIFLSVGYSTCHWCHVMAHESFEDDATAALLNEHFVSIKVDREERPDVDRVYMTFVQATTGSGGWPMSVWLTPDLEPFVGGTYFPPADRYGRPGFPTVLLRIAEAWRNDREKILAQGAQTLRRLRDYASQPSESGPEMGTALLARGYGQIADSFEPEHGGFSHAPKFPRPVMLNFLLRYATSDDKANARNARDMALLTLHKMADGGMHDHLGGGFHRYSVDRFWHIPHFEKMLYDQAQLAISYLEAFQVTGESLFAEAARDILDYVLRDMADPGGGFYSAEDADSLFEAGKPEHGEGAFYLWKQAEIDGALDADAALLFRTVYGVEADGNAPEGSDPHGEFTGKNTLIRRLTDEEAADALSLPVEAVRSRLRDSRKILLEIRNHRPRPHRDEKIITAWNGLMISAFARAAQVLGESRYRKAATDSAHFIRENLYSARTQTLLRNFCGGPARTGGFADDYAFLVQGLLDLYETTFDLADLQWALALQETQNRMFASPEGGFFGVTGEDASILIRMREDYDGAEPSPNSVAALNLLRLAAMTGRSDFQDRAANTLRSFGQQLARTPSALPQMLVALDWLLQPPALCVIVGNSGAEPLVEALHHPFLPRKILLRIDGEESRKWFADRLPYLRHVAPVNGKAAVYRCENFTCSLPLTDPSQLP